jgi:hypothetical protein
MATQGDVRRIALSLPGVREQEGHFAFGFEVKGKIKGFVWVWLERVDPKKARVPSKDAVAVRVRDQGEKAALLAGDPDIFFTEPHYDGYPAVLVRLKAIRVPQLRSLLASAWSGQAPKNLFLDASREGAVSAARPTGRRPAGGGRRPRRRTGA